MPLGLQPFIIGLVALSNQELIGVGYLLRAALEVLG